MSERIIATSGQDVAPLASGSIEALRAVPSGQTLNLASGGPERLIAVASETVGVIGT